MRVNYKGKPICQTTADRGPSSSVASSGEDRFISMACLHERSAFSGGCVASRAKPWRRDDSASPVRVPPLAARSRAMAVRAPALNSLSRARHGTNLSRFVESPTGRVMIAEDVPDGFLLVGAPIAYTHSKCSVRRGLSQPRSECARRG